MTNITIYHNPNCGTSRNTLALIRHMGIEPTIIYYLEQPPSEETLRDLLRKMEFTPRQLLRTNVPPYLENKLDDLTLNDDVLIQAMLSHPILINRPIVVTDKGVRLCRPSEVFLQIAPLPLQVDFVKEDGELILAGGK
ncbi:arsenate reductase (glutaredoxin) [Pelistega suis]|uniref:Arsenate reductase n=1 Tax=Pelistega suis TaxID=1631957 RepID=A0A849P998_9BURK|nr:arsenate reductase (glutaredoxin) [Pelistega suis]NOL51517.1 arsenate reductase (glutaredoxin) [Pelistega suis]